jgi:glycosyltransferase involved in cell wall biosynthesis
MRIVACTPQVPFSRGGTELLADTLIEELRARGHDVELVTVPFKWYPGAHVLQNALVWRLLDLEESEGSPIDLVIATKFPSYVLRHRRKVVWLVHQFRQAYELDGTDLGQFGEDPFDRATRRALHRLDAVTLGEARRLFAISANVADRLRQSLGLEAEVLRPPPQRLNYRCESYGDFVLSVGRLDRAKRVDLLLEAAATESALKVIVVGDGPDRERLEQLAGELELDGRVTFAGRVGDEALADFYARCLAVFYAPVDEDFGFVPYEAFLSEKPIVTTRDAGGPLEVVADGETGVVCEPAPAAVATAFAFLAANVEQARAQGRAGKAIAARLTWDAVIDRLLSAA